MQLDNRHRTTAFGRPAVRGVTVTDGAPPRTLHGYINTDTGVLGNTDGFLYEGGGPTPSQDSLQCWEPNQRWASYKRMEGGRLPAAAGREGGVNRPSAQWNKAETAEHQSSAVPLTAVEVPQFQAQSFEITPEIPSTTFLLNFSIDDLQDADLYAPPHTHALNPSSGDCFPTFVKEQVLSSSSSDSFSSFSPSSSFFDSVQLGADVQTRPMDYERLERMATGFASIHLDYSEQAANQCEGIYDDDPEITESANQLHRLFQQNDDGDTILHLAIIEGVTESVILPLIRVFAEQNLLNVPNNLQQTPLHLATIRRQDDVIAHLLRNGAKQKVFDRNLDTPLHIACRQRHMPSVKVLHPVHADQELEQELHDVIESSNKEGKTCLHVAVVDGSRVPSGSGQMDIVQYLIEDCKVNVNLKELRRGRTILHLAVEVRNFELVHYLLNLPDSYELIIDDLTYDCYSALQMAKGMRQTRMERLFLLAGAQPIMDIDAS